MGSPSATKGSLSLFRLRSAVRVTLRTMARTATIAKENTTTCWRITNWFKKITSVSHWKAKYNLPQACSYCNCQWLRQQQLHYLFVIPISNIWKLIIIVLETLHTSGDVEVWTLLLCAAQRCCVLLWVSSIGGHFHYCSFSVDDESNRRRLFLHSKISLASGMCWPAGTALGFNWPVERGISISYFSFVAAQQRSWSQQSRLLL